MPFQHPASDLSYRCIKEEWVEGKARVQQQTYTEKQTASGLNRGCKKNNVQGCSSPGSNQDQKAGTGNVSLLLQNVSLSSRNCIETDWNDLSASV